MGDLCGDWPGQLTHVRVVRASLPAHLRILMKNLWIESLVGHPASGRKNSFIVLAARICHETARLFRRLTPGLTTDWRGQCG